MVSAPARSTPVSAAVSDATRRSATRMRASSSSGTKRLGHVVVGAEVERVHLVGLRAARRQDDDRHRGLRADRAGTLPCPPDRATRGRGRSGRAASAAKIVERLCAGAGDVHLVSARAQQRPDGALNRRPRRRRAGCEGDGVIDAAELGGSASSTATGTAIVNCAPPSGQFSAQTRPCSAASSPRTIHRPMPVPEARVFAAAPR